MDHVARLIEELRSVEFTSEEAEEVAVAVRSRIREATLSFGVGDLVVVDSSHSRDYGFGVVTRVFESSRDDLRMRTVMVNYARGLVRTMVRPMQSSFPEIIRVGAAALSI